jgi:hypothetical protein
MTNSEQAIREFAEKWGIAEIFDEDTGQWEYKLCVDKCLSDLTALISEHYYPKERYDELLQQRDELKEALAEMIWQFGYRSTYEGRESLHTGGLSALESAFGALGLSDPIALLDFEAAIKNTER